MSLNFVAPMPFQDFFVIFERTFTISTSISGVCPAPDTSGANFLTLRMKSRTSARRAGVTRVCPAKLLTWSGTRNTFPSKEHLQISRSNELRSSRASLTP